MIIPAYKPIGITTHQLAKKVGESGIETPLTHTGSLDPMAEGVVVILTREDRFKKAELSEWRKTYEFEVLFGISTDTHDLLGLVTNTVTAPVDLDLLLKDITQSIPSLTGTYAQEIPRFSAKRIDGQSYFDLARKKIDFEPASQQITVFSLHSNQHQPVGLKYLDKHIQKTTALVNGDFRQEEIINTWTETINRLAKFKILTFPVVRFMATTSKRTYIRGIVRDLSQMIAIPATTYRLVRTQNGPFAIEDCAKLEELTRGDGLRNFSKSN